MGFLEILTLEPMGQKKKSLKFQEHPPFWGFLKLFGQSRTLVEMWKKNGFIPYHFFKNDGFEKIMVAFFFQYFEKMHKNDFLLP